ncbi:hypothetical protein LCGC14_3072630 [marine sediment metagenome]|uniref:Uncharacterized protein n=1 Tax=marine sediment metagenome TaxID=412755 RepID=A0A0F8X415_9ZZZZ
MVDTDQGQSMEKLLEEGILPRGIPLADRLFKAMGETDGSKHR